MGTGWSHSHPHRGEKGLRDPKKPKSSSIHGCPGSGSGRTIWEQGKGTRPSPAAPRMCPTRPCDGTAPLHAPCSEVMGVCLTQRCLSQTPNPSSFPAEVHSAPHHLCFWGETRREKGKRRCSREPPQENPKRRAPFANPLPNWGFRAAGLCLPEAVFQPSPKEITKQSTRKEK